MACLCARTKEMGKTGDGRFIASEKTLDIRQVPILFCSSETDPRLESAVSCEFPFLREEGKHELNAMDIFLNRIIQS